MSKKRRMFTDKELIELEVYGGLKLPMEHIAALFEMSKGWLEETLKKQEAARCALERGRSKASRKVHKTLYDMAMGSLAYTDEKTGVYHPAVPANFQAMRFWCQTQEGFKTADKLEVTIKDGDQLTDEQAKQKIAALLSKMQGYESGNS